MSAIRTAIIDGKDAVLDIWANRSHFEEDVSLNPGEAPIAYLRTRYDWSLFKRIDPDPDLVEAYDEPRRLIRRIMGGDSNGGMPA